MVNKILLFIALLSALLISIGCSTANAQKQQNPASATQEISITPEEFNQNPHIQKHIELFKDDQVVIRLVSNASTGFSWNENATIADGSVLQQLKHEDKGAASEKIGAAGAEEWTLRALKSGTTTVQLEYSRPWEGGEKDVWTFELTVTVK